jgi:hypothetical protein
MDRPLAFASGRPNTYSHLWPEDEDRTRTAVDSALLTGSRDTNVTHNAGQRG